MHLLLVSGEAAGATAPVFARALALFEALHGQVPAARHEDGAGFAAAAFPLPGGRGAALHPGAPFAAEVGVWFDAAGLHAAPFAPALLAGGAALEAAARGWDGYFALAAADPASGALAVMTDRCGALHLYRATTGGVTVLATSALVLAALTAAPFAPAAVREFLATGTVYGDRSLFAGVDKLAPATVWRFRRGAPEGAARWFAIEPLLHGAPGEGETRPGSVEELAAAMQAVLRRILARAERPVFDLTGGYDTRNVLATALSLGLTPTTTVVGMPESRDVVAANRIAATFGLAHHHHVPGRDLPEPGFADLEAAVALTDGEISALEYAAVAIVQRRTSEGFDLNVNGTFGELCRGYWWDALLPWVGRRDGFDPRDFAAKRFAVDGWADAMTRGLNPDTLLDHFTREVEQATAGLAGYPNTAGADACYYTIRMQRWGGRIASSTLHIRPLASPFFFLETMRPALSAPLLARFGGRMAARLVERLKPELAALPMADGYPALPLRLSTLPRFAPLGVDLATRAARKVMNKLLRRTADHVPGAVAAGFDVRQLPEIPDLLAPGAMRTRALYDAAALDGFLEGVRAGRPVPKGQIGRVITLELVARALARVA
jgi:hypothetical protein